MLSIHVFFCCINCFFLFPKTFRPYQNKKNFLPALNYFSKKYVIYVYFSLKGTPPAHAAVGLSQRFELPGGQSEPAVGPASPPPGGVRGPDGREEGKRRGRGQHPAVLTAAGDVPQVKKI